MAAEGKVIQRADIRPVESSVYMNLKKYESLTCSVTLYLYSSLHYFGITLCLYYLVVIFIKTIHLKLTCYIQCIQYLYTYRHHMTLYTVYSVFVHLQTSYDML